jgi:hypothetical protein
MEKRIGFIAILGKLPGTSRIRSRRVRGGMR